ncbi:MULTISPECIES: hypothetical protein [unclassified Neisseria]|uniref:hypothetical protein n=1 Tax=unclassified Neisseria TaxID=2623750 RepID=UPI0010721AC4|nr:MULTISPECIES: hypothetical protein [unclassified Neisseria]MBF0804480.1 hypothetical protein [Neisseria sp. 19428wB4_WF04]TFU40545.1 hypothetical protein E4T99_09010 [Neisseria sp. WF04]
MQNTFRPSEKIQCHHSPQAEIHMKILTRRSNKRLKQTPALPRRRECGKSSLVIFCRLDKSLRPSENTCPMQTFQTA